MPKPPIKQKYIETPEKLWELFKEYRAFAKNTPILVHDYVGKDGVSVYREKERPLTFEGFDNYVFERGEINQLRDYFDNRDGRYETYVHICSRIKQIIRQDQVDGGMVGVYNPSITQRLNNITEKVENNVNGQTTKTIIFKHEPLDGE